MRPFYGILWFIPLGGGGFSRKASTSKPCEVVGILLRGYRVATRIRVYAEGKLGKPLIWK